MSVKLIRRITGYVAVPVVTAGIIGGAAIGLAGVAGADTTPSHPGGNLASVNMPKASASDPTGKKASVNMPKASVSAPAGKKASVADRASRRA